MYIDKCGYGHIDFDCKNLPTHIITEDIRNQLPEMVHIKLLNGANATVAKDLLKSKVTLRVKSFHGSRKIHTIEANIDSTIETVKDLIINGDSEGDFKDFVQIKLIYTIVSKLFNLGET